MNRMNIPSLRISFECSEFWAKKKLVTDELSMDLSKNYPTTSEA